MNESMLFLNLTAHTVLYELHESLLFPLSLSISGGFVAAPAPEVL